MSKFSMPNLSFSIGSVIITPFFWSLVLAVFLSSFCIWKKLKEDFEEEEIMRLTLMSFISALLFSRVIFIIFNFSDFLSNLTWLSSVGNNFSITGAFWGIILALVQANRKLKKNIWEIFDSFSLPILGLLFFGGLGYAAKTGKILDASLAFAGVLGFLFFLFWKKKYRSWSWYKSGRTGFLFWSTAFYAFFAMVALALSKGNDLYWEELGWVFSLVACVGVIYYRSGRKVKEDFDLRKIIRRKNG